MSGVLRRPVAKSKELPPELILFDIGGVLIRWKDEVVFRKVAERYQLSFSQVTAAILPLRELLQTGQIPLREMWERLSKQLGVPFPEDFHELWAGTLLRMSRPNRAVLDLAKALRKRGFTTGLFSNTDAIHTLLFEESGWFTDFEPWILSYQLGVTKPAPAAFRAAAKLAGIPARKILFIDDRRENVESARKSGWRALPFRTVRELKADLRREHLL